MGDPELTDEEVAELRDDCRIFAELIIAALLRMRLRGEDVRDDGARGDADGFAPVHEMRWRPLQMRLMRLGPVRGIGGVTAARVAAPVHRDAPSLMQHFDHRRRQVRGDGGAHELVRHAVVSWFSGNVAA
jgi:hypothetical protein